jgi:maltokinase
VPEAIDAWRQAGLADLEAALAIDADDRGDLLAAAPRLRQDLDGLPAAEPVATQATHGDLHVGQLLDGPDGLRIIDFDGSAGRGGSLDRGPTARDVAHLLVSLELVAEVARGRSDADRGEPLATWTAEARSDLLVAYRTAISVVPTRTSFDERLVGPFVARQLCRELLYADSILPRWRYAPMGAIARLYAGRP